MLLQDRDDLLFGVSLALHIGTSLRSEYREIPHSGWLTWRGYGQTNAFGELERALIIERTKAGMAAARRRGSQIGRPPSLSRKQIELARMEIGTGQITVPDLAAALGVSPRTIYRAVSASHADDR